MRRRPFSLTRDYARVLAIQRVSWPINFPGSPFSEPAFRSGLARAQHPGGVYVYEEGDELVAWLWLDYGSLGEAHIRQLQVQEAHWGQGIGRRILSDAIALSAARGCRAVTLTVTKSNKRAMALYEHFGFEVTRDAGARTDAARQRMRLVLPTDEDEPDE